MPGDWRSVVGDRYKNAAVFRHGQQVTGIGKPLLRKGKVTIFIQEKEIGK
jgi:hypothetical protein